MKVLLLSPPYLKYYMRNARCDFISLSKTQWFPIFLGFCGALLEKYGHEVRIIDAPAYHYSHDGTVRTVKEFNPDLIVIYASLMSKKNDIAFAERLKQILPVPNVFVGPYVSINPVEWLEESLSVDMAVKSEFEYPVLEIASGESPSNINNIIHRSGDTIITNPVRELLTTEQMDAIPFASIFFRRHLDFKYYKTVSEYHPFIDMMTGRGCAWGRCTYCLWVHSFIPGAVYNLRSIENVIEEFKFITTNISEVRSVMIQDDTLTSDRAKEISEGLLKNNIHIAWSCYARGNMNYETLALMKKAGCRNLHVGYESANNDILRKMKKGLFREQMNRFTEDAKKAGLRIHGDFAIGFEGETIDTIMETIDWAKKLNPESAQFQLMIPYPSTPFHNSLKQKNALTGGKPDYPHLPFETMVRLSKKAYRDFYISFRYARKIIKHPYEHLFGNLGTIMKAIESVLT